MKILCLLIFSVIMCTNLNVLQAQNLSLSQKSAIEKAVTEEMKSAGIPGGALAIINEDTTVFRKGFGLANLETRTAITDSSIFQVSSITKIFTALTVLKELNEANIEILEPVGSVIKGLSPGVSSISFQQLLTHTGGLIDYTNPSDPTGVYEFFKKTGDTILFTEPGRVFSYSNIGYALLGIVIEQLTGVSYTESVTRAVIKPLGLRNTSFDLFEVACKSFSTGHIPRKGSLTPTIMHFDVPLLKAGGGIFSNLLDLERLSKCLMNRGELDGVQVFEQKIIEQMSFPHYENFMAGAPSQFEFLNFPNNAYGFGLFMFDYSNLHFLGNAGSGSQMAYLLFDPNIKFSIIMVGNRAMEIMFNSIGNIIEVVLGIQNLPNTGIKSNREEWNEITAKYYLPAYNRGNLRSVEVFEKNEKLYISFNGRGETELKQIGPLVFKYSSPYSRFPMVISFHKDELRNIAYMRSIWRTWLRAD